MEKPSELEARFYLAEVLGEESPVQSGSALLRCADCGILVWHQSPEQFEGMPLCPKCFVWRMSVQAAANNTGFVLGQGAD